MTGRYLMVSSRDRRGLPELCTHDQERAYRTTAWCSHACSGDCRSNCTLTQWWDISQERARQLQWLSRGTLGRTGWETMRVELPLWSVVRTAQSSGLRWIGSWLRACGEDLWAVFWWVSAAAISWKKYPRLSSGKWWRLHICKSCFLWETLAPCYLMEGHHNRFTLNIL